MASIKELPDGRVRVRVKVQGVVRQQVCSKEDAPAVCDMLRERIKEELNSPRCVDVFKSFLKYKKRRLALLSYTRLESTVRNHVLPAVAGLRWYNLTPDIINDAINVRGASYSTCKKIKEAFSACDKFAIDRGLSDRTIMRRIELTKKAPTPNVEVFSPDEVALIRKYGMEERYGVIFLLVLYTGLRAGEVCSLTWGDIRGDTIYVHTTAIEHKGVKVEDGPKTPSSTRAIPLLKDAVELLPKIREFWGESHDLIIYDEKGGPVAPAYLTNLFKSFLKRHDIPKKKNALHALRDTFASSLINSGADLVTVSKILGHSSSRVTEEHYICVSDAHKREAVDLLKF